MRGSSQLLLVPAEASHASRWVALAYLVSLSMAELSTTLLDPAIGLALYSVLLVALLWHAVDLGDRSGRDLLLTLTFVPLSRLVGLSMHSSGISAIYRELFISVPLLLAALLAARVLGRSWKEVGLNLYRLPIQILVGVSGVALGYVQYAILIPASPAGGLSWLQLCLQSLILVVGVGFTQEVIVRGLLQSAAMEVFGQSGIVYVASLFAVLQMGYGSPVYIFFGFAVSLYFGWIALTTRSIAGVILAHGVASIVAFLALPLGFSFPAIH